MIRLIFFVYLQSNSEHVYAVFVPRVSLGIITSRNSYHNPSVLLQTVQESILHQCEALEGGEARNK